MNLGGTQTVYNSFFSKKYGFKLESVAHFMHDCFIVVLFSLIVLFLYTLYIFILQDIIQAYVFQSSPMPLYFLAFVTHIFSQVTCYYSISSDHLQELEWIKSPVNLG
jgi:hypothetical protein